MVVQDLLQFIWSKDAEIWDDEDGWEAWKSWKFKVTPYYKL